MNLTSLASQGVRVTSREVKPFEQLELSFTSARSLSSILKQAQEGHIAVVPGRMRPLPAKFSATGVVFVNSRPLSRILELSPEDGYVIVEAGLSLGQLNEQLAAQELWYPADNSDLLVGQSIQTSSGGCLEHGYGGPRRLVLGLSAVLASGDIVNFGGRVLKNVTGYDLTRLFIGSHGTLGLVVKACLRLYALPRAKAVVVWKSNHLLDLLSLSQKILHSGLTLSLLECLDTKLLPELVSSRDRFILITACHGSLSVVKEIAQSLAQLSNSGQVFENDAACHYLEELSLLEPPHENIYLLRASIPTTIFPELFQELSLESPLFALQPSTGYLRFFARTQIELSGLITKLQEYSQKTGHSISLAFADDEFEYRVLRLPSDSISNLSRQLKQRYDPEGILNPLVSL